MWALLLACTAVARLVAMGGNDAMWGNDASLRLPLYAVSCCSRELAARGAHAGRFLILQGLQRHWNSGLSSCGYFFRTLIVCCSVELRPAESVSVMDAVRVVCFRPAPFVENLTPRRNV